MRADSKKLVPFFTLLMPILAVAIALVALYFALLDRRDQREVTGNDNVATISEAQAVLERANDAVLSVDLILSFLEGASVLAGIILIGAGVLGIRSIQELRQDTEAMKQEVLERLAKAEHELVEQVERAQQSLFNKAEQLAVLEAELEKAIISNHERIDKQVQTASKEARRSFEALSYHVMAQRLARENNVDAAIIACREAYELDPENVANNYLMGTLLIKKNELDEAIERLTAAFNAALEDSEEVSTPAQATLGLAIRQKGDQTTDPFERNRLYNQAENYLLEATHHDPKLLTEERESYFGVLGSLYRRQGRTQDAINAYHHAAEITPRRSYPFINLAMLYLSAGDQQKMKHYRQEGEQRALRRLADTPDDHWARHDVALAFYLKGEMDEAVRMFDEAIELSPNVWVLESVLARLLYLKNIQADTPRIEEAIDRFLDGKKRFKVSSD